MKVCPKCNSSYSDETLNFCLTDGIPLVVEELLEGHLSKSENWQEAETLFDNDFKIHPLSAHDTSPNSSSDTNPKLHLKTKSFSTSQPKSGRAYLFPLLGVFSMLVVVGGIFGWLYMNPSAPPDSTNKQNQTGQKEANSKRMTVPLSVEQESEVRKGVSDLLEAWRQSIEKRDADANVRFYVDTLETYYKESGIDRNHVRADRQRAFDRYGVLSLQTDNIKINAETNESASAVFDKSWTFKSESKITTGSVQQEMYFSKQDGRWLISGEKDVKVYYINNRENPLGSSNSSQNSQTSNQ